MSNPLSVYLTLRQLRRQLEAPGSTAPLVDQYPWAGGWMARQHAVRLVNLLARSRYPDSGKNIVTVLNAIHPDWRSMARVARLVSSKRFFQIDSERLNFLAFARTDAACRLVCDSINQHRESFEREFSRHNRAPSVASCDELLECLSLMQHTGADACLATAHGTYRKFVGHRGEDVKPSFHKLLNAMGNAGGDRCADILAVEATEGLIPYKRGDDILFDSRYLDIKERAAAGLLSIIIHKHSQSMGAPMALSHIVVSALEKMLSEPVAGVRAAAAQALGLISPASWSAAWERLAADPSPQVRGVVAQYVAQGHLGGDSERLVAMLRDRDANVSQNALSALTAPVQPVVVKAILDLVLDWNVSLSSQALRELDRNCPEWASTSFALDILPRLRDRLSVPHNPAVLRAIEKIDAKWPNSVFGRSCIPNLLLASIHGEASHAGVAAEVLVKIASDDWFREATSALPKLIEAMCGRYVRNTIYDEYRGTELHVLQNAQTYLPKLDTSWASSEEAQACLPDLLRRYFGNNRFTSRNVGHKSEILEIIHERPTGKEVTRWALDHIDPDWPHSKAALKFIEEALHSAEPENKEYRNQTACVGLCELPSDAVAPLLMEALARATPARLEPLVRVAMVHVEHPLLRQQLLLLAHSTDETTRAVFAGRATLPFALYAVARKNSVTYVETRRAVLDSVN